MTRKSLSNQWLLGILLAAVISIALPSRATALDRVASVGLSVLIPVEFQPDEKMGDTTYSIHLAAFISENWAWDVDWDFGLEGLSRVDLATGPRFFILRDGPLLPYVSAGFLYSFYPSGDLGWRGDFGLEWNLRWATGVDNLRFFWEIGASQFFVKNAPNQLLFDASRFGLTWSM